MGMFFNKDIKTLFVGGAEVSAVYMGSEQVWPTGLPVGTVFNFDYTGTVQSVELPRGRYKLQCWGAQGGRSAKSSSYTGSKGGYSEGELTLTEKTTLYVFVGGQGSYGSSSSLVNGGWNGGGASVGYSAYNSSGTNGYSYPACGGGATDISTVTSSMSYSSGRTNRSSASLLARCIVAGGGAGASYRYTSKETTTTTTKSKYRTSYHDYGNQITISFYEDGDWAYPMTPTIKGLPSGYSYTNAWEDYRESSGCWVYWISIFHPSYPNYADQGTIPHEDVYITYQVSTTSTSNSSGYSNKSQQGGGTSGVGTYPGTQSSAGNNGGFGYGGNQTATNYRYCAGGAGGGWYGGGCSYSDSSTSYVNYTGGGSGFVNTEANAGYRPSGYTGLQLDSGSTTAGNLSHPSTSGGTETGHSGNGYARITVID